MEEKIKLIPKYIIGGTTRPLAKRHDYKKGEVQYDTDSAGNVVARLTAKGADNNWYRVAQGSTGYTYDGTRNILNGKKWNLHKTQYSDGSIGTTQKGKFTRSGGTKGLNIWNRNANLYNMDLPTVEKVQKLMQDKGYYNGEVDKKWGNLSTTAYEKFKKDYKRQGNDWIQINKPKIQNITNTNPHTLSEDKKEGYYYRPAKFPTQNKKIYLGKDNYWYAKPEGNNPDYKIGFRNDNVDYGFVGNKLENHFLNTSMEDVEQPTIQNTYLKNINPTFNKEKDSWSNGNRHYQKSIYMDPYRGITSNRNGFLFSGDKYVGFNTPQGVYILEQKHGGKLIPRR